MPTRGDHPTTLGQYCRINTSLLRKKSGKVSAIDMGQGCRTSSPGFESPGCGESWQSLHSESWLQKGIWKEGTVWVFPYKVDRSQVLGAGGQPSLLPQAPGVMEHQSPSGHHLVTPVCSQSSFSVSGKGGSCLAWCFCK